MTVPRLQMFELEDLPWFPQTIRDLATDYLHFLETRFALHEPLVPLLRAALEQSNTSRVVDLCSGAAGLVPRLYEDLTGAGVPVSFFLTDKYPNLDAFRLVSARHPEGISYSIESIDATAVPPDLKGMRTMFNAFHHFAPQGAQRVLRCAVEAKQPIGIFEMPERRLTTLFSLLFTPVFVCLATPFIRPFRWRRLLWTYLIPLVPLTSCWDGLVSQLRAYTAAEMLVLAQDLKDYDWNAGRIGIRGGKLGHVTYLLGMPRPVNLSCTDRAIIRPWNK